MDGWIFLCTVGEYHTLELYGKELHWPSLPHVLPLLYPVGFSAWTSALLALNKEKENEVEKVTIPENQK